MAAAISAAMRLLVSLIVVALLASPAEAGKRKNPKAAFSLSFGGAVVGWALAINVVEHDHAMIGVGGLALIVVGPSFGNVYNGEYGKAAATAGIRAGAIGLVILGAMEAFDHGSDDKDEGYAAMIGGGVVALGTTIYDLVDAPRSAHRHNARMTVVPTALPAKDGLAPGLVLAGSF